MPKRHKSHQIEDISRRAFEDLLPDRWVWRDKNKDYGIDGEVEIFDSKEHDTGLVFWVQLKGTESQNKTKILSVDLNVETLQYYKKLDIPVLLVRHSVVEEACYIKWVDNFDPYYVKDGAKTLRIRFDKHDKWNENSHELIERKIIISKNLRVGKFQFPVVAYIAIKENIIANVSRTLLISKIKSDIQKYSEFIELTENKDEAIVKIEITTRELKINLFDLSVSTFHNLNKQNKVELKTKITEDIILGFALTFNGIGQAELFARIFVESNIVNRLYVREDILVHYLPILLTSSHFSTILGSISDFLDEAENEHLDGLTQILLLRHRKGKQYSVTDKSAIETFMQRSITRLKQKNTNTGVEQYNLANYYLSTNDYQNAVLQYIQAKRFEPDYLKQPYYYRELAGALFLLGRYVMASKVYKKLIEMNADQKVKHLYADALMFSGQYKEAYFALSEYTKSTEKPLDEYILKHYCLSTIINKFGVTAQIRQSEQAEEINFGDPTLSLMDFEEGLKNLDLLSNFIWFNFGIWFKEREEFDNSGFCFLMAAISRNGDKEAWRNAAITYMNIPEASVWFVCIIRTGYFFHKEEFLLEVYSLIESQQGPELLEKFSVAFEKIIEDLKMRNNKEKEMPVVRIKGKDGMFRNIFDELSDN